MKELMSVWMELSKFRITFFVTISAAVGYFCKNTELSYDLLFTVIGVFLLSCGSSALNHCQDVHIDLKMHRTANRPIPSGRITRLGAFLTALVWILFGFAALTSVKQDILVLSIFGGLAIFWYNVVYYALKRRSAFAVVPGSIIGAIPPMMGWIGAGGQWNDFYCILLGGFFFIWQIPHFWLLQLNKINDYKLSGLPVITDIFSIKQANRITLIWVWGTAATGMVFPMVSNSEIWWRLLIVFASIWLSFAIIKIIKKNNPSKKPYLRAFMEINLYALVVMVSLIAGGM